MFEVGKVYNRRSDLHRLFTGESGEQYGYRDGWDDNGVFLYTGEGQVGDMAFVRGNWAIRNHAKDGKDLHLFQSLGKGGGYRYAGRFTCPSWEFREGVDINGDKRRVIVFHLIQPEEDVEPTSPTQSSATLTNRRQHALNCEYAIGGCGRRSRWA